MIELDRIDVKRGKSVVGWVRLSHLPGVRFEIATHTGYRAILPECVHDGFVGGREICVKETGTTQRCSGRRHCHKGHEAHARKLAALVARTYRP